MGDNFLTDSVFLRQEELGLSLNQLSKMSGIAKSTLLAIKKGKASPRISTLSKICDALDCNISLVIKPK